MTKIAFAQMCIDYDDTQNNISLSRDMLKCAVDNHCEVIIFPELWTTGFRLGNHKEFSSINALILQDLHLFSDEMNLDIIGSYIYKKRNKYFNEYIALRPDLKPVHYSKINLFPTLQETVYLQPGNQICVFHSKLGFCGASICFDLRFPWMYKEMAQKGAQIQIIPAHWPTARIHHWDILLQARVIETLSYVIAVNSVGKSGNVSFGEHSSVISPDGNIVFQAGANTEELFVVEIDPTLTQKVRNSHPFFSSII